jgi:putative transposase
MKPVSKEEFLAILERQQKSGLSIRDFCANEFYTVSSFHYWKPKFGLTRPYNNNASGTSTNMLAPIKVNLPVKAPVSSGASSPGSSQGEIWIKLPVGSAAEKQIEKQTRTRKKERSNCKILEDLPVVGKPTMSLTRSCTG